MDDLLRSAAERSIRYLNGLSERSVAPDAEALLALRDLRGPLPSEGADPVEVLEILDRVGSPATVATAGPRYFGFVVGGCLPGALAASWLAHAWDQNAAFYELSPVGAFLEEVALEWLLDVLDLPRTSAGAFVTGGSLANFTALAAARHFVLRRAGWDVDRDGLFGAPPVTVMIGEEAHPTITKALGLLGLGRSRVHTVPTDREGRIRADALPPIDGPTIICTQVGNVNTGAADPVGEICRVARPQGAWVHVDGAFGLWARASPRLRPLVRGVDAADSWATDAHKWLNAPYDCGVAIVRDGDALRAAMSMTADYLPPEAERRKPSDFSPELSRRARGVEVWAAMRELGRSGIRDLVERCCDHAARFAAGLEAAGYRILNGVELNQVLVSFGDPETTLRVVRRIQEDGICWCGPTRWHDQTAMRISVSSWATTEQDVEQSLAAVLAAAEAVRRDNERSAEHGA